MAKTTMRGKPSANPLSGTAKAEAYELAWNRPAAMGDGYGPMPAQLLRA